MVYPIPEFTDFLDNGRDTWEGFTFVPSSATAVPRYAMQESLVDGFDSGAGGTRYSKWTGVNINSGRAYPYPRKYRVTSNNASVKESLILFRLAEQFLIRSEAYWGLAKYGESRADLNTVRERAGLLPLDDLEGDDLLDAIVTERRFELFAEAGHRWYDLKRLEKIDATLSVVKDNWTTEAALFPIPQRERDTNPKLGQNEGYR